MPAGGMEYFPWNLAGLLDEKPSVAYTEPVGPAWRTSAGRDPLDIEMGPRSTGYPIAHVHG